MEVGSTGFVRDVLAATSLFAGLEAASLDRLCEAATQMAVRGGQWLFRQGDEGDALYVVAGGRFDVVVDDAGRAVVVRSCRRGDVFGELSIVCEAPRTASIVAVRDGELWRIGRSHVEALLRDSPEFAIGLTRFLGDKVRTAPVPAVPPPQRRPTVVAVVAAGAADVGPMVDAVASVAGETTLVLDAAAGAGADPASWPVPVDAAEAAGRKVVLVSARGDPDSWRAFCTRQADRVVAVVDADAAVSADAASVPTGCDLVVVGTPERRRLRALLESAEPRAHHLVANGGDRSSLARAARRVAGASIGVVLSGGGARGLAHIGVLAGLSEAGIVVDRFGGTSMGALIAALAARGLAPDEMVAVCRAELVEHRPFNDYTAPRVALLRGRKARSMIERACGGLNIEELPRDFFAVSADLVSTEAVVHRRGPCADAVIASMSLPGLAPPVRRFGRVLVDGGVLQNLPVPEMVRRDEGPVLAVDVTAATGRLGAGDALPSIVETLTRSTMLGSRRATVESGRQARLAFRPRVDDVGLMDFARLDTLVERGRDAVRDVLGAGALAGLADD